MMALRRADHSCKESYRLCKQDYETEEEARAQQIAVQPLMNELNNTEGCTLELECFLQDYTFFGLEIEHTNISKHFKTYFICCNVRMWCFNVFSRYSV
jgi:hypothetical protein